jgi:Fe2+ transport system protein FeoA
MPYRFHPPRQNISNRISQNRGSRLIKPLTECICGEELTVIRVNAGYRAKVRLANLGIIPGVKIKKMKNAPFRGPIEIKVKGSSLVLGRGLASRILVRSNSSYA